MYPVLHTGSSTQQIPLEGFQGVTKVGAGQEFCVFSRSNAGLEAALKLTDQLLFCFLCVCCDLHRYHPLVKADAALASICQGSVLICLQSNVCTTVGPLDHQQCLHAGSISYSFYVCNSGSSGVEELPASICFTIC